MPRFAALWNKNCDNVGEKMIGYSAKVALPIYGAGVCSLVPALIPMSQPSSEAPDRQIRITPELDTLLKNRKKAGMAVKAQIAAALENYLAQEPNNAHRALLPSGEDLRRKLVPIPDVLWKRAWDRKENFGLDLDEQVHIALTLYFADLNDADPFTNEPLKISGEDTAKSVISEDLRRLGIKTGKELVEGVNPITHNPLLMAAQIIINNAAIEAGNSLSLWQLPSVPCGPWKGIPEDAQPFEISKQLAELVGAKSGDLLVPTDGESMVEAGIPDKGNLIMRLLNGRRPEIGEIVLCVIEREGDVWQSTIKHWFGFSHGKVVLKNGKTQDVPLPQDVVEVQPIATLIGVIGKATFGTAKGLSTEARKRRQKPSEDYDPLSE